MKYFSVIDFEIFGENEYLKPDFNKQKFTESWKINKARP